MSQRKFFPLKKAITINSIYTSFEAKYEKDFYFDGEQHDFWELVFVIDGKIGVAEDNKIYELEKNQIIFHKPMEFHRLWTIGSDIAHLIIMSFSASDGIIDRLGEGVFTLDPVDYDLLYAAFRTAKKCFFALSSYANPCTSQIPAVTNDIEGQYIANRMELLFLNLLRSSTQSAAQIKSISALNYKKIITVLNEHIYDNITVPEIARECSLSVSNLKKTFSMYSGTGVISYFNKMKITKAISMLLSDASIAEVSETLGFSSQNYFSAVFKREMGISPGTYRKKSNAQQEE